MPVPVLLGCRISVGSSATPWLQSTYCATPRCSLYRLLLPHSTPTPPALRRIVVNPTELREALDCETHFKQQEMNDAMELLDTLYECFRKAQGAGSVQGSRGVLVDSVFGLLVKEAVACRCADEGWCSLMCCCVCCGAPACAKEAVACRCVVMRGGGSTHGPGSAGVAHAAAEPALLCQLLLKQAKCA